MQHAGNVLLIGPSGVGKSHIAAALAAQLIEQNKSISMPKGHGFALTPYKGALGIINAIP